MIALSAVIVASVGLWVVLLAGVRGWPLAVVGATSAVVTAIAWSVLEDTKRRVHARFEEDMRQGGWHHYPDGSWGTDEVDDDDVGDRKE